MNINEDNDNNNNSGIIRVNTSLKSKNKNKNSLEISNLLSENINLFTNRTKYELMYEAFYISNLFYEMYDTSNHLKDPYFYIINSEWIIKWKKYVNYDFYTKENGWKKFIKLNILPFRPKYLTSKNDNYLKYIKDNTKTKIFNYFDSYFLSNNENNYPGYINNEILLLDRNQKDSYLNRNQIQSNFNYNILDKMKYKENYIWVTEDIWKYFFCVYGGFEIRRHNLCLNNNHNNNNNNEIILESKLKTINLIIFHYYIDYRYKIDPPKKLYISHLSTIRQIKEKIKEIITYVNELNINDIRLWVLDENMTDKDFYKYVRNIRIKIKGINFPGLSLDIFNENIKMESLEEKILNNKNFIILELPFVSIKKNKLYYFNKPIFNNYSDEMKLICLDINQNNKIIDYTNSFYDHIAIMTNDGGEFIINMKLFLIKKFFWNKYILEKIKHCPCSDIHIHLERIINNFTDKNIQNMFNEEIKDFKKNMDLIFDKSFLANNMKNLYLSEFDHTDNNKNIEENQYNYNYEKNEKEQNLLKKKRKKEEDELNIIESEVESDDISWYTCGFCKKNLNQKNYKVCSFCLRKKYCDNNCRIKDIEQHLKQCEKIN